MSPQGGWPGLKTAYRQDRRLATLKAELERPADRVTLPPRNAAHLIKVEWTCQNKRVHFVNIIERLELLLRAATLSQPALEPAHEAPLVEAPHVPEAEREHVTKLE